MKMKVTVTALFILLFVCSCESFWRDAADEGSKQNQVIEAIGDGAKTVKDNAPLLGPAGVPAAVIATGIAALIGYYNDKRKKLTIIGKDIVIAGQTTAFNNVTETTKAIVEAVDVLDDAVKIKIKDEVKKKLQEHQIYKIGKSIISGLKA